jgi:hypothetical protein
MTNGTVRAKEVQTLDTYTNRVETRRLVAAEYDSESSDLGLGAIEQMTVK